MKLIQRREAHAQIFSDGSNLMKNLSSILKNLKSALYLQNFQEWAILSLLIAPHKEPFTESASRMTNTTIQGKNQTCIVLSPKSHLLLWMLLINHPWGNLSNKAKGSLNPKLSEVTWSFATPQPQMWAVPHQERHNRKVNFMPQSKAKKQPTCNREQIQDTPPIQRAKMKR